MTAYKNARDALRGEPRVWLVTGAAGFIGSSLTEALLSLDQKVIALDNFATGFRSNIEDVLARVQPDQAARFHFIEGDIRNSETCRSACSAVDYVLHQAALGSVPRSIHDPVLTNQANVDGFLNMLVAARDAGVQRFIYAASSSTYGDHPALPKHEDRIGRPLSPYAVTKYVNELYADVFSRVYGVSTIGLRYFNVFGRRQDPDGAYAAVIPRWIGRMLAGIPCEINGDGESSRDFCYVENVVQANILAATTDMQPGYADVFNVAYGGRTTLKELFEAMRTALHSRIPDLQIAPPVHAPFRSGDVRHSQADITKAHKILGYEPTHSLLDGLDEAVRWYVTRADMLSRRG